MSTTCGEDKWLSRWLHNPEIVGSIPIPAIPNLKEGGVQCIVKNVQYVKGWVIAVVRNMRFVTAAMATAG